jgi:tetratricopeptide (TPR) repeat protein
VKKELGLEHPDVAQTLNNLELLYCHMGAYGKALPLYQRALDIREKVLGPQHPNVTIIQSNLARLYEDMGDYVKALTFYQKIRKSSNCQKK